eukprot:6876137-Alexandrium_andersonii.AAC.1
MSWRLLTIRMDTILGVMKPSPCCPTWKMPYSQPLPDAQEDAGGIAFENAQRLLLPRTGKRHVSGVRMLGMEICHEPLRR